MWNYSGLNNHLKFKIHQILYFYFPRLNQSSKKLVTKQLGKTFNFTANKDAFNSLRFHNSEHSTKQQYNFFFPKLKIELESQLSSVAQRCSPDCNTSNQGLINGPTTEAEREKNEEIQPTYLCQRRMMHALWGTMGKMRFLCWTRETTFCALGLIGEAAKQHMRVCPFLTTHCMPPSLTQPSVHGDCQAKCRKTLTTLDSCFNDAFSWKTLTWGMTGPTDWPWGAQQGKVSQDQKIIMYLKS